MTKNTEDEKIAINSSVTSSSADDNDSDLTNEVPHKPAKQRRHANIYTTEYRLFKTALLMISWISSGWNLEMPRIALEDLKILLNTNYYYVSILMIFGHVGQIIATLLTGLIMHRFLKYMDIIIAIGGILISLTTALLPWSKVYWVSLLLFFLTGCSKSTYDIGTSQSILGLWHGISSSPINGLHAAYGIGGVAASQIMQPFIKADPFDDNFAKNQTNLTNSLTPNDIHLEVPFACGGILGILVSLGFLISQYYEIKQLHVHKTHEDDDEDDEEVADELSNGNSIESKAVVDNASSDEFTYSADKIRFVRLQKLLFQNIVYKNRAIYIILSQVALINLLFLNIYSFLTTLGYMRTYVTKGPAQLTVDDYMLVQTTFWVCFIIGRILAVFIGYKMNEFLFYGLLLVSTSISLFLFTLPALNTQKTSIFVIFSFVGLVSGPLLPSVYMIATSVFKHLSSFMVALSFVATSFGGIICQFTTGYLLDNFQPSSNWFYYAQPTSIYIIPLLMLFYTLTSSVIFIFVFFIHVKSQKYLSENVQDRIM